ncbi:DUF1203 domain-containing protein [Parvularcula sp. LCG005]|uniref:DUF1203 domain-containing protein n=1 Tax=Parvularcula sp. LCG005 TaxID=3078805 RepID=UPI002942EC6A|nr:DUF1203 domain-containing protein [Parvularcula sp. LCG005]WOI54503.1 DUF1203 domain-containing protein [Parvularcula sp. LCG005]
MKASSCPGFPCRISLEDAPIGEDVLLVNFEHHAVMSPYRSTYAIYVRPDVRQAAPYKSALPPILWNRPIAIRAFDAEGMLIGADLGKNEMLPEKIDRLLDVKGAQYLHLHNAMHGCYAASVMR